MRRLMRRCLSSVLLHSSCQKSFQGGAKLNDIVPRLLALILLCSSLFAAAPSAAQLARALREAGFDADECYRVHDLSFQKEDIRVYLTDGYLIFSKSIQGHPQSALFTSDVEGGDGEVILLPPFRGERQSLAQFTKSPNLDEHFRTALIIFTDNGAQILRDRIEKEGSGHRVQEMGVLLADQWAPVLANVESSFEMRMVADLLAPPDQTGMLFLALNGRQLNTFDILYDPSLHDQIMAGQLSDRDGHVGYDIWTSFPARSTRSGANKPRDVSYRVSNFRIDAALDSDLRMKATTRVTVQVGARPTRVFWFSIAHAMHVSAARIDGKPAELFFQDSIRSRALNGYENDTFLMVPAEPLDARSEHEFEFEHDGAVIASAGTGVFYVGARSTWYPRSGDAFATYDLTFRYPKRLTLVTAGDVEEDRIDGDWRITRRRTPVPIRQAGFNLGEYEKVMGTAPGYTIEVYGNRHFASALQPKRAPEPHTPPSTPGPLRIPRYGRNAAPPSVPEMVAQPDPLARLHAIAAEVSSSLEFFSSRFGPPALKTLSVTPIPGAFGQGFPGLVYLSSISYLDPADLPANLRSPQRQLFFSDLIEAHEVAHQWWGNVVTASAYQDEWLPEALANYSALLWVEKRKGPKAVESVLDGYREHLLAKRPDGRTVESAGPITWGTRLEASGIPDAWRAITYEKGSWILHMLRRRLGDDAFMKMLAELRRRYEFRSVSTEEFRDLAKQFRPPRTSANLIDEFFDNWVYSTGVPSVKFQSTVRGVAPAVKVTGTISQSGVDEDFSVEVPVEIQFAKGPPRTIWVPTSGEPVPFSVTVPGLPDRQGDLLPVL